MQCVEYSSKYPSTQNRSVLARLAGQVRNCLSVIKLGPGIRAVLTGDTVAIGEVKKLVRLRLNCLLLVGVCQG